MTQDEPGIRSNEEVRSDDSQSDMGESQLREEYSTAVMQRLIDLGYMDAGLDI